MQKNDQTPLINVTSKERNDEDSLKANNVDVSSDPNIVISRSDEQMGTDNALTLSLSAVNVATVNSFQDRGVEGSDKSQQPTKEGFNSSFNNPSTPPHYSKVESKPVDYKHDSPFALNEQSEIKTLLDYNDHVIQLKNPVRLLIEPSQTGVQDQDTYSANIADKLSVRSDDQTVQNPLTGLTLDDILLNKALSNESHAFIWDDATRQFTQVAAHDAPKPAGGIWTPCDAHSDVIELVEQYPLVENTLYKDEAGQSYIFCDSYIPEPPSGYTLDTLLYYLKPTYWGGYEISGSLIKFVEIPHDNNLTNNDDELKALSLLDVIDSSENVLDSLNTPLNPDIEVHHQESSLSSNENSYHFVTQNIDLSSDSNFEI
jgi:hypothetical protein